MAKILRGIDPSRIRDPIPRRFWQYTKDSLDEVNSVLGGPIIKELITNAPPGPSPLDSRYFVLPGVAAGQTALDVTTSFNTPIFTLKSNIIGSSPSTKFVLTDSGGLNVAQLGMDISNIYTTTTNYGGTITLGRSDGTYVPTMLTVNSGGSIGTTQAAWFTPGVGLLGIQKGVSTHATLDLWLRNNNATAIASALQIGIGNTYSGSIYSTYIIGQSTASTNGTLVFSANAGAAAIFSMAAFYIQTTGTSVASYTQQGIWDFIHSAGTNSTPMMIYQAKSGQTGDFARWQTSGASVLAKIDISGNMTAASFIGPLTGNVSTLTTRGDLLTRDASNQIRLAVGGNDTFLKSNGTDPAWASIVEGDVGGSGTFVRLAAANIMTGGSITGSSSCYNTNSDFSAFDTNFLTQIDSSSGFHVYYSYQTVGTLTGDVNVIVPSGGGVLVTGINTVSLTNKTLGGGTSNFIVCTSASSGVAFKDSSTSSKILRLKVANLTASTNSLLAFRGSAARTWEFPDHELTVVGKHGSTEAGNLSDVNLTAQTSAIGSTNLVASPPAGLYRISAVAMCTTASGSGSPTLDVTIGWTDNVGAQSTKVYTALSLSATTTTAVNATPLTIRANSGNITYSTTINSASGSPQYALYLRCEAL